MVPMARIERATSPLPRECSTTEPHGHVNLGAGEGNRTLVVSLEGFCSTIELHPRATLSPSLSQTFKIKARGTFQPSLRRPPSSLGLHFKIQANIAWIQVWVSGGGGWIRTNVGARPTDLQSAPFNHSGTPPAENLRL